MSIDTSSGTTSSDFLEKLKKALARDGDFPASARVVSELREVISKPESTTNQVAEIILREPSLGTRVLHLVNSSFYRRAKPIMTVSQAVIQIGMRPLAELCSGLILLQKFIPVARKGGPFAQCLKKTITTSILTSSISAELDKHSRAKAAKSGTASALKDETGYLAGTFAEMGTLLLAYYFPKLYESAERRAETKQLSMAQSIQELVGLSPIEISIQVLEELQLPEEYKKVLSGAAEKSLADVKKSESSEEDPMDRMIDALYAGSTLSQAINEKSSSGTLEDAIAEINSKISLESVLLSDVLGKLVDSYRDYCSSLELQLPGLPEELQHYKAKIAAAQAAGQGAGKGGEEELLNEEEQFLDFVEEIRIAVENREPTASVITTVMETFAWSLGFDRVFLMLFGPGKQKLNGRMLLGHIPGFDPKTFTREVKGEGTRFAPEVIALTESRPVYRGDPIFPDGWPFAAIPVGFDKRSVGIIYADRSSATGGQELSSREEAAIGVLAELLDRSISLNR
ncbi:MAG: HDOD domain-containing protein [Bdellovibrionales bacterium]|nr:HDOD domain-containing protein [Bdellovibrionales bacterium]